MTRFPVPDANPRIMAGCFFGCQARPSCGGYMIDFRVRSTCGERKWDWVQTHRVVKRALLDVAWQAVGGQGVDIVSQLFPIARGAAERGDWQDYGAWDAGVIERDGADGWDLVCIRGYWPDDIWHSPSHTHPDIVRIGPVPFVSIRDWMRACRLYAAGSIGERREVKQAVLGRSGLSPASTPADQWVELFFRDLALTKAGLLTSAVMADFAQRVDAVPVPSVGLDYTLGIAGLLK